MKREEEMDGEELWIRFLIKFILISVLLYFTIKLTLSFQSLY
jgi:hypothetical protein